VKKYIFRIDKYKNENSLFKLNITVSVEANNFRDALEKVSEYMRKNKMNDANSCFIDTIEISI